MLKYLLAILLLTSCEEDLRYKKKDEAAQLFQQGVIVNVSEIAPDEILPWVAIDIAKNLVYIKDTRTNLCYAASWGGGTNGGAAMADAPCSDAVMKLVKIYRY